MDRKYLIQDASQIPSPSLVVYLDLVQKNIERAIALADGDVSKLRPHVKTHKTAEIIAMQREAGITKQKCATLREAKMIAEAGVTDILIAYQMVGPNIERLVALKREFPDADFKVIVDHPDGVKMLSQAMAENGMTIKTMLDLNAGMNRTGIDAGDAAVDLYAQIEDAEGLVTWGLHVYDGHIHDEDLEDRRKSCAHSMALVAEMKDRLSAKGLDVPLVVMGGTPTFPIYAKTPEIEASPGTFIFFDYGYSTRYPDLGFTPATLLLSRIISIPTADQITLDLGYKAIAADPQGVRGKVVSIEGAELAHQNEEHWIVKIPAGTVVRLGQEVYVCPTHVCPTVAIHQSYYLIDREGNCIDKWQVTARNRELYA
ncbi:MAG: D-TA family PLP-dependent enzyme [Candidatus Poribacteria bacterium]|nr:D-TA family PLP-dependent enzyme [Candidatus Poribacteria bacterium]